MFLKFHRIFDCSATQDWIPTPSKDEHFLQPVCSFSSLVGMEFSSKARTVRNLIKEICTVRFFVLEIVCNCPGFYSMDSMHQAINMAPLPAVNNATCRFTCTSGNIFLVIRNIYIYTHINCVINKQFSLFPYGFF